MAEPYYKTYVETMHRLNLRGAEVMVYSALLFLCSKGPYKGSYQELADFSLCGVDETANNTVKKLVKKGLIIKNEQGISLPNILGKEPNILGKEPNILENSKEKSTKKENKIKEEKVVVGQKDVKSQPQQQDFFNVFIPPTWDEIVSFATSKKMPESLYTKFYSYYVANNWTLKRGAKMENWKATLTYWFETEKESAVKSLYHGIYGRANEQQQAEYAGSQYAAYKARKEREKQEEDARQKNIETRTCSYDDYKNSK